MLLDMLAVIDPTILEMLSQPKARYETSFVKNILELEVVIIIFPILNGIA
jgi:hypothetical protein